EVRNLAARSADAAKETTAMIENSIERVEYGTKITNDTAEALESIVESVENAACLVSEIAAASNEQASGIAQINQAIMQVSQVIQTNSATAEEGASASEELSGQAELLNEMVKKFKINTVSRKIDELDSDTLKIINSLKNSTEYEEKASNKEINLKDEDFGKY
ncbi:MAG: methyl-accepting chemotaxis protein, partial [Clostridium sp.]|nr:methyl-accepting chemotaxis protein [Clostridium sp.]